jgi:hypothetical protein
MNETQSGNAPQDIWRQAKNEEYLRDYIAEMHARGALHNECDDCLEGGHEV